MLMWAELSEKVPNVLMVLSRWHTKRKNIKNKFFKKNSKKSVSYQKKDGYDNDSGHEGPFRITQPMCCC